MNFRLKAFATGNPVPIEVIAILPGTREDETRFHNYFSEYRHKNEWFRCEGRLAVWVNALAFPGRRHVVDVNNVLDAPTPSSSAAVDRLVEEGSIMPKILSEDEVVKSFPGLTPRALRAARKSGMLRFLKFGRNTAYTTQALADWLDF